MAEGGRGKVKGESIFIFQEGCGERTIGVEWGKIKVGDVSVGGMDT